MNEILMPSNILQGHIFFLFQSFVVEIFAFEKQITETAGQSSWVFHYLDDHQVHLCTSINERHIKEQRPNFLLTHAAL